ncbi:Laminin IV [Trinorchestia longiramus]|nr:Laminin IV [Trinorchestia longiramus]
MPSSTEGCNSDRFSCDGVCFPDIIRCNNKTECTDGTDEIGCPGLPEGCLSDQFSCDGVCFPDIIRCNDKTECADGTDEIGCPGLPESCLSDQFSCDGVCFPDIIRCNDKTECTDGTDEIGCPGLPEGCLSDQFSCDGVCFPDIIRCNDKTECADGTDEIGCPDSCFMNISVYLTQYTPIILHYFYMPSSTEDCNSDQFSCDGVCFPDIIRCNNKTECTDGTDEIGCPGLPEGCLSDQFSCDGVCFPDIIRCNDKTECADGTDEIGCPAHQLQRVKEAAAAVERASGRVIGSITDNHKVNQQYCKLFERLAYSYYTALFYMPSSTEDCNLDQFSCDGVCFPDIIRCNNRDECVDGTDEADCPGKCADSEWRCVDGTCIPSNLRCNGLLNCYDNSDEEGCPESCSADEWACEDGLCIPAHLRCNGLINCHDSSDEKDCPILTTPSTNTSVYCPPDTWRCEDNKACIPSYTRCDGAANCYDGSDEKGCKVCPAHQWLCEDQHCIPIRARCDGRRDCPDGSDEIFCSGGCEPDEFQCVNGRCIRRTWQCDLDDDCGDGSDETNCGLFLPGQPCPPRYFTCFDRRTCIARSQQCNGRRECRDGSDELGCVGPSIIRPPPIQKSSPLHSTFEITCQATGVPTPIIVWRFNNRHLPANCIQTNNEGLSALRCTNINRSYQGTFSCEAHNNLGSAKAQPNTFFVVREKPSICFFPTFNDGADTPDDCLECFCFGATKTCSSSERMRTQLPLPKTEKLEIVTLLFNPPSPDARNAFISTAAEEASVYGYYYKLPPLYLGNLLKSYGGALHYDVLSAAESQPFFVPDAVMMGKNETLIYYSTHSYGRQIRQKRTVPFEPSEWYLAAVKRKMPSRAHMMVVLQATDSFLIRAPPHVSGIGFAPVDHFLLDTAGEENAASGVVERAVTVEECQCPRGYSGSSCESCEDGFHRETSQLYPYGQCIRK